MTQASTLRRRWLDRAFENAGVDASHWDPSRGVDVNRQTIERVYAYYGLLYLRHGRLEWAGMANMIGPSFYAGFLDIGFLPDRTRSLVEKIRRLDEASGRLARWLLRRDPPAAEQLTGDLGFFETTFLTMQRKIFEDQALMHEAYLGGGIQAIRELSAAGIIDSATAQAWEQIDAGDPAPVHAGNRTLLYREQHDIIDSFYVDMRDHSPPSGRVFTYLLTLAGLPAVPGAKSYCDVFPLAIAARVSRQARVVLRTPLAAGNLALFDNRWKLIDEDTLPVYQRLIADQPAEARALIERPVQTRAGRFRMLRRIGAVTRALLTHWRLAVEEPLAARMAALTNVAVDLTTPPSRGPEGDSRVWSNLRREPFRVTVSLPGARTFSTDAVLAVLFSAEPGGDPTRLSLKLPATDLDGITRTLEELTPEWRLNASDVGSWAARAAVVTTAHHAYSTRVFDAQPAGFVRVEFQVEHHLEPDKYVLDVLFSWDASAQRPHRTR